MGFESASREHGDVHVHHTDVITGGQRRHIAAGGHHARLVGVLARDADGWPVEWWRREMFTRTTEALVLNGSEARLARYTKLSV